MSGRRLLLLQPSSLPPLKKGNRCGIAKLKGGQEAYSYRTIFCTKRSDHGPATNINNSIKCYTHVERRHGLSYIFSIEQSVSAIGFIYKKHILSTAVSFNTVQNLTKEVSFK